MSYFLQNGMGFFGIAPSFFIHSLPYPNIDTVSDLEIQKSVLIKVYISAAFS